MNEQLHRKVDSNPLNEHNQQPAHGFELTSTIFQPVIKFCRLSKVVDLFQCDNLSLKSTRIRAAQIESTQIRVNKVDKTNVRS